MDSNSKKPSFPTKRLLDEQWYRYLRFIKKHAVKEPYGLRKCFTELKVSYFYERLYFTAVTAHDLIVPLFDKRRRARSLSAVMKSIKQAGDVLHKRFPQPVDKCPECGQPGVVRLVGYPGPIVVAAERLRYAASGGCIGGIGSSGGNARICVSCHHRWESEIPYDLKIFEYLKDRYPVKPQYSVPDAKVNKNFSIRDSLGKCPQCHGQVFAMNQFYACQNTTLYSPACNFRVSKSILSQEISIPDVQELLESGRSRLIKGFISLRTGKKFSARLLVSPDGKVIFEFDEATLARIKKIKKGVARR